MWLIFAAAGVFVLAVLVYVLFMIFLPEWVGITGKNALDAEKTHRGGEAGPDSIMTKLQGRSHYLEGEKDRNPKSKKD
jgi:hypothetical protein